MRAAVKFDMSFDMRFGMPFDMKRRMRRLSSLSRLSALRSRPTRFAALLLLFSGLSLPALSGKAVAQCVEVEKRCVDTADRVVNGVTVSRDCWRWERTFRCSVPSPDRDRCTPPNIPDACRVTASGCASESVTGECLETESELLCTARPEGPGITALDPEVTVGYETVTHPSEPLRSDAPKSGALPDGCVVTRRVCRDDAPREIPVTNLPGETATAAPDCWLWETTLSCPSPESAASCGQLEAAGCRPEGEKSCVATDAAGACVRWAATYVCPGLGITGPDIEVGDTEDVPTGGVVEDTSECDAKLDEAKKDGLECRAVSKTCAKPLEGRGAKESGERDVAEGAANGAAEDVADCALWDVRYECVGKGRNGCEALEALAEDGTCRLEGEPECLRTDATGACVEMRSAYVCGEGVSGANPPEGGELTEEGLVEAVRPTDTCGPVNANPSCVLTDSVCTEGPGIKLVDGQPVYKDCWAKTHTYLCRAEGVDECERFERDPACRLVEASCAEGDEDAGGSCLRPLRVYRCEREGEETFLGTTCDGESCIAGVCAPTDSDPNREFADAVVGFEIGRQGSVYGDVTGNRFFQGQLRTCKDRVGAASCCRTEVVPSTSNADAFSVWLAFGATVGTEALKYVGSPYVYDVLNWSDNTSWLLNALYGSAGSGAYSPSFSWWGVTVSYTSAGGFAFEFSPTGFLAAALLHFYEGYKSCDAEDQQTSLARGQRLCHYVGTVCEEKYAGKCVTTRQKYVCFNSRLARILNEEGRAQLGRGWGTPAHPDVRGFTQEELEALDFTRMNLDEFLRDVLKEALEGVDAGTVDLGAVSKRAEERVEGMLSGQLGELEAVPGAVGKTRNPRATREGYAPRTGMPPFFSRRPWSVLGPTKGPHAPAGRRLREALDAWNAAAELAKDPTQAFRRGFFANTDRAPSGSADGRAEPSRPSGHPTNRRNDDNR